MKTNTNKKVWEKPELKSISIKKNTHSGTGTGKENPVKRPAS